MKQPNSLFFILSAKKIISVNALYGAKMMYRGSKPVATLYKKSEAKKMEEYIKEQVKALDIPNNYPWIGRDTRFKFTFTVIFKSGFYMRDLDNCCKNLIDGIFRALGYNDSHILEIQAKKTLCPEIDEEKILVQMSEYTGETRFDKITEPTPHPGRIYLGGTGTWREEFIKELEGTDISWFNPENKTPEEKNREKTEMCDTELYILSPGYDTVLSIAESVIAVHEAILGGYGCVVFGVLGTEDEWGETWNSLDATIKLLNTLSAGSRRVIAKFINEPKEIIKEWKTKSKNSKRSRKK